jgi:hypothetical protein
VPSVERLLHPLFSGTRDDVAMLASPDRNSLTSSFNENSATGMNVGTRVMQPMLVRVPLAPLSRYGTSKLLRVDTCDVVARPANSELLHTAHKC